MTSPIAMIKIDADRDFTDGRCDCCENPSGRRHLCPDCEKIWIWTDFHNAYIKKTDLFSEMKREYDNWASGTELGRTLAQKAGELMEVVKREEKRFKTNPSLGQTPNTKGVRKAYLPDCMAHAEKVSIEPIGLNNMCFQNAGWVEEHFGFPRVFGFNIIACKCGGRMPLEIHALNRFADGRYFDITRDFCGETEKWFVEFANKDFNHEYYRALFGRQFVCYEPSCRCTKGKGWDNRKFLWTDTEAKIEKVWKIIEDFDESLVEPSDFVLRA